MVWGGFTFNHKTDLLRVDGRITDVRYRDEILNPIVIPFARTAGRMFEFQHDNARRHITHVCRDRQRAAGVRVLQWPAESPDLNPIEHLSDVLGRNVRDRPVQPNNLDELFVALQEEWRRIPVGTIRTLIRSMPRRCQAVLQRHGRQTRY